MATFRTTENKPLVGYPMFKAPVNNGVLQVSFNDLGDAQYHFNKDSFKLNGSSLIGGVLDSDNNHYLMLINDGSIIDDINFLVYSEGKKDSKWGTDYKANGFSESPFICLCVEHIPQLKALAKWLNERSLFVKPRRAEINVNLKLNDESITKALDILESVTAMLIAETNPEQKELIAKSLLGMDISKYLANESMQKMMDKNGFTKAIDIISAYSVLGGIFEIIYSEKQLPLQKKTITLESGITVDSDEEEYFCFPYTVVNDSGLAVDYKPNSPFNVGKSGGSGYSKGGNSTTILEAPSFKHDETRKAFTEALKMVGLEELDWATLPIHYRIQISLALAGVSVIPDNVVGVEADSSNDSQINQGVAKTTTTTRKTK